MLLISLTMFSQKIDKIYDNNIVNIGISDKYDLSIMFADRFYKRMYGCIEYNFNTKSYRESFLGGIGIGSNKCVALAKGGVSYTRNENNELIGKFDYGLEYLWLLNTKKKITLCYGMAYTKYSGVQLKLGTSF